MAGPDFSRGTENLGFFVIYQFLNMGHSLRDYVASKCVINLWPQEESQVTNRFHDYHCPQPSQQSCQAGTVMTVHLLSPPNSWPPCQIPREELDPRFRIPARVRVLVLVPPAPSDSLPPKPDRSSLTFHRKSQQGPL